MKFLAVNVSSVEKPPTPTLSPVDRAGLIVATSNSYAGVIEAGFWTGAWAELDAAFDSTNAIDTQTANNPAAPTNALLRVPSMSRNIFKSEVVVADIAPSSTVLHPDSRHWEPKI
jgi:hypothetical protein